MGGLAEHRTGAKPWPLSCFTHQSNPTSAPCDVEGDMSPEEVRWEYLKSGGAGCGGSSQAAQAVNGAIMSHVQALAAYATGAQQDPAGFCQKHRQAMAAKGELMHLVLQAQTHRDRREPDLAFESDQNPNRQSGWINLVVFCFQDLCLPGVPAHTSCEAQHFFPMSVGIGRKDV